MVDNAIKHGANGGVVSMAILREAGRSVLSVVDNGPGIPVEERPNVFKRFYRLEHGRNTPGNGLGLSLVSAVASLHGARIDMADNAPGLRIELSFPNAEPAANAVLSL